MTSALIYGQRIDPANGLVQPWFTHGALNEIQTWDLADKVVLEYGGGLSSLWWADRCRRVFTIETDEGWCGRIRDRAPANLFLHHRVWQPLDMYVEIPVGCFPDIVAIDGDVQGGDIVALRRACLVKSLILPRPITIIFDNWQQDDVFIDTVSEEMMQPYHGMFYVQADHTNHSGRPWQTAIWKLHKL